MVQTSNKHRQVEEIRRCARDPTYFFKTYVRVSHPTKGPIPFNTFDFQDECTRAFVEHRYVIINKSRQLGLSTLAAAYAAWLLIFHRNKEVIVMATKLKVAMNFIRKVKFCVQNLPKWLVLPKIVEDNKQSLIFGFPSNSRIEAIPTSEDAGRSEALSLLIVDEAAHVANFEELWKGLYPTLSTGGRAIVLSTPKGIGNHFHKLWVDAQDGANEFHPIELPWNMHPERDEEWFREQTMNMSPKAIAQELLCVGGDTKIVTKCGFKRACDVVVGDEVLTHLGRFRHVTKRHERVVNPSKENVYAISTPMNRQSEIVITGNHPMLSVKLLVPAMKDLGIRDAIIEAGGLQFNNVDELASYSTENWDRRVQAALFPRFQASNVSSTLTEIDLSTLMEKTEVAGDEIRYPGQWGANKRFMKVDYGLGRFVGLWLSDGYANPNNRFGVGFGFHVDEYDTLLAFVDKFLQSYGMRTRPSKMSYSNACRIETHNQFMVRILRMFVGGYYAHDKLLNWDAIMQTSLAFIRGLLVGYFEGDGTHHPQKKLTVVSCHSQLLYQVRTLLSMFGYYPRIGYTKEQPGYLEFDCVNGRKLDQLLECGSQDVTLEKKGSRTRLINEHFLGKPHFQLINDELDGQLHVYNFEVEDDHTYVADSLVVHNCDFLSSGDTYLDSSDIDWVGHCVKKPVRREGPDNNVWVWGEPIRDSEIGYIIPADVGRGDGNDFSTFHIICMATGEVVAEFRGKIRPDLFAKLLMEYGKRYNDALVVPERNSYGHHVIVELVNRGYTNIYFRNQKGVFIGDYIPPDRIADAGFDVQRDSRKQIVAKLEEVIRNRQIRINSSRLHNELKTFITHGDKPQAQRNCHDDLVMALAIGTWLFDASATHSQYAQSLNRAMLAGFGMSSNSFDDMAGNGNEVLPSWIGMVPQLGGGPGASPGPAPRRRSPGGQLDMGWLFR